jgi:hypothetical protein
VRATVHLQDQRVARPADVVDRVVQDALDLPAVGALPRERLGARDAELSRRRAVLLETWPAAAAVCIREIDGARLGECAAGDQPLRTVARRSETPPNTKSSPKSIGVIAPPSRLTLYSFCVSPSAALK